MNPVLEYLASVELLVIFGVASGVLSTFAYIPYIVDTVARRTQPQRASWLIWSVLGSIAFMSQIFEGASSSLWFAGVQVSGTIIVFVLSIWIGQGKYLSKSDYLILLAAAVGLVLWYLTENAAYALAITISISLLGGAATVVKAYREPESETLITWVVSFVASICAILSVGVLDYTLLAYPLYLFTLYFMFIVAIVLGRRRDARADQASVTPARRLSVAPLFTGLRRAADAVIVSAAFVFAFNWIGANSSAVDTATMRGFATDKLRSLDIVPAETIGKVEQPDLPAPATEGRPARLFNSEAPQSSANNNVLAGRAQVNSVLTDGGTVTVSLGRDTELNSLFGHVQVDVEESATKIVVVAVDRGQTVARPWILHDSDPVAVEAKQQVREWLKANAKTAPVPGDSVFSDSERQPQAVAAAPPSIVETTVTTGARPVLAANRVSPSNPELMQGYLQLDEDDPFARLVVISDMAVLERSYDSVLPQSELGFGERVRALATNGEWYKVQIGGGVQGYLHHTNVSVDGFSLLSKQHAG